MRPMEISINRLARYFKTTPELWMGMQLEYDLRVAVRSVGSEVKKRVRPFGA